jgi:hypothetical protein
MCHQGVAAVQCKGIKSRSSQQHTVCRRLANLAMPMTADISPSTRIADAWPSRKQYGWPAVMFLSEAHTFLMESSCFVHCHRNRGSNRPLFTLRNGWRGQWWW